MPNYEGFTATNREATQDEILRGFEALLKAEFAEWPDEAIYWTETADPNPSLSLDLFIQIHAGAGQFDQGIELGGGPAQENAMVGVTIWHRSELDQTGMAEQSMFATSGGLLGLKRRVLKALRGKMLQDEDGIQIACGTIKVAQALEPTPADVNSDQPLDHLGMFFSVEFAWDLS